MLFFLNIIYFPTHRFKHFDVLIFIFYTTSKFCSNYLLRDLLKTMNSTIAYLFCLYVFFNIFNWRCQRNNKSIRVIYFVIKKCIN